MSSDAQRTKGPGDAIAPALIERLAPRSVLLCIVFVPLSVGFFIPVWLGHVIGELKEEHPEKSSPSGLLVIVWLLLFAVNGSSFELAQSQIPLPAGSSLRFFHDLSVLGFVVAFLVLELRIRNRLNTNLFAPRSVPPLSLPLTIFLGFPYMQARLNALLKARP